MERLTAWANVRNGRQAYSIKADKEKDNSVEGSKGTLEAIAEIFNRLAYYEDLEEQGRLEILTPEQKEAQNRLRNYSAEDRYFDEEYS